MQWVSCDMKYWGSLTVFPRSQQKWHCTAPFWMLWFFTNPVCVYLYIHSVSLFGWSWGGADLRHNIKLNSTTATMWATYSFWNWNCKPGTGEMGSVTHCRNHLQSIRQNDERVSAGQSSEPKSITRKLCNSKNFSARKTSKRRSNDTSTE